MDTTEEMLRPIKPINCGQDGSVWLANNGLAVKVPHKKNSRIAKIESEVAWDLYNNRISVPKPEGIFRILIAGEERRGFGMKYIQDSIPGYLSTEAEGQILEEIRKVHNLGYKIRDTDYKQNTLWVPKEKRIYLIDFVGWKKIRQSQQ